MNTTTPNALDAAPAPTQSQSDKPKGRKRDRRRISGQAGVEGHRLAVSMDKLDLNKYAYRWISNSPARIHQMTVQDDWEIVTNSGSRVKEDSDDLGDAVSHVVGVDQAGKPLHGYLCRKLLEYFDEDHDEKMKKLDEQLESLKRGKTRNGESQSDYVPSSGIRLE